MLITEFQKLPEGEPRVKKVGEKFLDGDKMIEQKLDVEEGMLVTYFEITDVKDKSVEFTTKFERIDSVRPAQLQLFPHTER